MNGGANGTQPNPWPDGSTFAHYAGPMRPAPRSELEQTLLELGMVTLGGLAVVIMFLLIGFIASRPQTA